MNFIDLLLLLMILGFLAMGFFQGILKIVIAIVSFYVSVILASLYFQVMAVWMRQSLKTNIDIGQVIAFGLILLIGFLLLTAAGFYTFRYVKMPAALDFLDRIIGTLLGLGLGALITGIFAELLVLLFVMRTPSATANFPVLRAIESASRTSTVIPIFQNYVLPLIFSVIAPVLPPEAAQMLGIR